MPEDRIEFANSHRLLVPGPVDVEADAVDDEGDVDDDEEVVGVPEHVEAAEPPQRVTLAELPPAEPRVRQRVGDGHEHHQSTMITPVTPSTPLTNHQ